VHKAGKFIKVRILALRAFRMNTAYSQLLS